MDKRKMAHIILAFGIGALILLPLLESAPSASAQGGEEGYVPPKPPEKPPTWPVVFPSLAVAILIITLILLALGMRWG